MIGFELVASLHHTATEEPCQLQHVPFRSHQNLPASVGQEGERHRGTGGRGFYGPCLGVA